MSDSLSRRVSYIKLGIVDVVFGLIRAFINFPRAFAAYEIILANTNRNFLQNLYLFIKSVGFARIVKRYHPSRLHCHFLSEPSTIGLLVSVLEDIPLSLSGHARDVFGRASQKSLNPELLDKKIARADFTAICNKKAFDVCSKISPDKVVLIYHGVNFSEIKRDSVEQLTEPAVPTVVSIGRLEEKKGLTYLIEASAILKQRSIIHKVTIIGPGSKYSEYLELIKNAGLQGIVEILGEGHGLPNKEALSYLANATVFVLPSLETKEKDAEGIPNALIEASALQVPVIATSTGSIQEAFKDGINSLIVPPQNSQALADSIEKMILNRSLRETLSKKANAELRLKFNLDENVIKLESYLLK